MSESCKEADILDPSDRPGPECREVIGGFVSTRPYGKSSRPYSALNGRAGRQRTGSDWVQCAACSGVTVTHLAGGAT